MKDSPESPQKPSSEELKEQVKNQKKKNQKLFLSSVIFFLLLLATIFVIAIVLIFFGKMHGTKEKYKICDRPVCKNMTTFLKSIMDLNADPCNDFFRFVCGNFEQAYGPRTYMRDHYPSANAKNILINGILSKEKSSSATVEFVKTFYRRCHENVLDEKKELETIKTFIEQLGGMPLMSMDTYKSKISLWSRQIILLSVFSNYNEDSIFPLGVFISIRKDEEGNVSITIPNKETLLLPQELYANDTARSLFLEKFKAQYVNVVCLFLRKSCTKKGKKYIYMDIQKIFKFDFKLYQMAQSKELSQNYTDVTVSDLVKSIPEIPWMEVFNRIWRTNVDRNFTFLKVPKNYYKNLSIFLKKEKSELVANYLGFSLLNQFLPFAIKEETHRNVVVTLGQPFNKTKECFGIVDATFSEALNRIFITDALKVVPSKVEMAVKELIANVREGFIQNVQEKEWIDSKTKSLVTEKLRSMTLHIGYPNWIMNDVKLLRYYFLKQKTNTQTFTDLLKVVYHYSAKEAFEELKYPSYKSDRWPISTYTIHSLYNSRRNALFVPFSHVFPISYWKNGLKAFNYGALGCTAGHDMGHSVDNEGVEYDLYGNFLSTKESWNEASYKAFTDRKMCLQSQYDNFFDKIFNIGLNGTRTIDEDMSDLSGIRASYRGYLLSGPEDERLPDFEQFDDRKLFFISFATNWCSSENTEMMLKAITGRHSPDRYRSFLPPSNFDEFAKAFNCPERSVMNRKDKCVVW